MGLAPESDAVLIPGLESVFAGLVLVEMGVLVLGVEVERGTLGIGVVVALILVRL